MKKEEIIRTIYYKDVVDFFKSIGMFEKLFKGEIRCRFCGDVITIENFRAVTRKSNELIFCCNKESCIQNFTFYLRSVEK